MRIPRGDLIKVGTCLLLDFLLCTGVDLPDTSQDGLAGGADTARGVSGRSCSILPGRQHVPEEAGSNVRTRRDGCLRVSPCQSSLQRQEKQMC